MACPHGDRRNPSSRRVRILHDWVRRVVLIAGAVALSVLFTDARVVDVQREGCERRQEIFRELAAALEDGAENAETEFEASRDRIRADHIRANIVGDCAAAYPHIVPFVR